MAFPIRFFWAWQQFTIVAKVPFRLKLIDIVTEYGPVVITMPYIGYACRAFWNEHALIPVIFCRSVRQTESDSGSPAKNFSDDCAHLRKAWSVGICRETRTTDHAIKLSLCSALYLGEGYHCKCPPHQCGRCRLKPSTTTTHRNYPCQLKETITYYIMPARYAISRSDRWLRSWCSINDALKLGRNPTLAYRICQYGALTFQ